MWVCTRAHVCRVHGGRVEVASVRHRVAVAALHSLQCRRRCARARTLRIRVALAVGRSPVLARPADPGARSVGCMRAPWMGAPWLPGRAGGALLPILPPSGWCQQPPPSLKHFCACGEWFSCFMSGLLDDGRDAAWDNFPPQHGSLSRRPLPARRKTSAWRGSTTWRRRT